MATYTYRARDLSGKMVSGALTLASEEAVRQHLRTHDLFAVHIRRAAGASPGARWGLPCRVTLADLVVFSRQFATMFRAGVQIVETLRSLAEQTENPTLRAALEDVRQDVESGIALATAVTKHRAIFPEMFISLVRAGEVGGSLDESLETAARQLDKDLDLREKIKSAMAYPVIVLIATAVILAIMLTFIVPVFANIYQRMHAELPLMTKLLVLMSYGLTHWAPVVVSVILGCAWFLRRLYNSDKGRLFFDRLKLRLPVLGPLYRKVAIARFVRTLTSMLSSGVSLPRAIDIAAGVAGSRPIADAARMAIEDIQHGHPMSTTLERSGVFPRMVTQMIAVGEGAGSLDEMLTETAAYYEREVEYTVKRLTTLLEPLLTAFLATIVGFVVVALYLPIFGLGKALMHSN